MTGTSMQPLRRRFERVAPQFPHFAGVLQAVSERLLDRLELLAIQPQRILDLGCRNGYQCSGLLERYPEACVIGLDPYADAMNLSPAIAGTQTAGAIALAADPHFLPLADNSIDLVVSNLLLPWCHDPDQVFAEVQRVLSVGGACLFTSAGPDTLQEYRHLWADIDTHDHVFGLVDMHDLGDAMLRAGFADPVLDRDTLAVDYPDIDALQNELHGLGAANLAPGRRPGLMNASVRTALRSAAAAGQRFAVTLELVQGHGWKGEAASSALAADGSYRVSLESVGGRRRNRSHR